MKRKTNNYSISKILRNQNKSNDYFEILLANLSLEEIIALKFELGYKAIGFPLHGFPIWKSMNYIAKEALLKYAVAMAPTKNEAAAMLGITPIKFFKLLKKYNIKKYFEEKNNDTSESKQIKTNIS